MRSSASNPVSALRRRDFRYSMCQYISSATAHLTVCCCTSNLTMAKPKHLAHNELPDCEEADGDSAKVRVRVDRRRAWP